MGPLASLIPFPFLVLDKVRLEIFKVNQDSVGDVINLMMKQLCAILNIYFNVGL